MPLTDARGARGAPLAENPAPTPPGPPGPLAHAESRTPSRSPHESLVGALEAAAKDGAPFLTMHVGKQPVVVDACTALAGAWRYGAMLRRAGVAPGDRVPILMPTSPDFVYALLGTMLVRAVPAPLASPMTFGSPDRYLKNLSAIVEDAEARSIVTSPRMRDAIAADAGLKGRLEQVLTAEDATGEVPLDPRMPSIGASDTALVQYTSGTTGRPKGVVISHRALVANAYAIVTGLRTGRDDVGVSWLPMFHDMGLIGVVVATLCHPYPVHVLSPESFVMQPGRWISLLSKVKGTMSPAPNFAYDLCVSRGAEADGHDLGHWRAALNGAESVHVATVERFADRYGPAGFRREAMLPVYGLAESTLAVTFPDLERSFETLPIDRTALEERGVAVDATGAGAYVAVSVGRPVAGATISIASNGGAILPERQVGEIRVSGASLMDGYFRNDEASAEALSGGWLRTGDLGFMDEGRLFVVGRSKDVIIKGGRNIHPQDVERIALEVDGVRGAAAFARPNEAVGTDDIVLVAETRENDAGKRAAIEKQIRAELLAVLGVKADAIELWPLGGIPRTTSGKIRRKECARLLENRGRA